MELQPQRSLTTEPSAKTAGVPAWSLLQTVDRLKATLLTGGKGEKDVAAGNFCPSYNPNKLCGHA